MFGSHSSFSARSAEMACRIQCLRLSTVVVVAFYFTASFVAISQMLCNASDFFVFAVLPLCFESSSTIEAAYSARMCMYVCMLLLSQSQSLLLHARPFHLFRRRSRRRRQLCCWRMRCVDGAIAVIFTAMLLFFLLFFLLLLLLLLSYITWHSFMAPLALVLFDCLLLKCRKCNTFDCCAA